MRSKVIFVRHAESVSNVNRELSCNYKNNRLSKQGQKQAKRTASLIKSLYHVDEIYSSPLRQTLITASIINRETQKIVNIDNRLTKINLGTLELEENPKIKWSKFWEIYRSWKEGNLNTSFPQGESYNQIRDRLHEFLIDLANKHPEQTIVVVSHGGIIQLFVSEFGDIADTRITNCSITESELEVDTQDERLQAKIIVNGVTNHLNGKASRLLENIIDVEQKV